MSNSSASPSPAERTITLDVALLGRDYKVACKEGERAELLDAVALLQGRLQEIRAGGKVTSTERIAVTAALNLAHDLLRERASATTAAESAPKAQGESIDEVLARRRIQVMREAIDAALANR